MNYREDDADLLEAFKSVVDNLAFLQIHALVDS